MPYKDPEQRARYAKLHYEQNKSAYIRRAKAHTAKSRAEVRDHIAGVVAEASCVDCGVSDPIVLEFDHVDPLAKRFCIGNAAMQGFSLRSVKDEIAKCQIRCANCHRRKTHRDRHR